MVTVAYAERKTTVETVFGNAKANLGFRASPAEDSTPHQANGGSSAPSTTCSRSTGTDSPPPEPASTIHAPPPQNPPPGLSMRQPTERGFLGSGGET